MDFNNLYKHVGYAQSLPLPAAVHRNGKALEKCHSISALRKEKGHLKNGPNQAENFRGNGAHRK